MVKVGSDFSGVGAFDQSLMRLGINYKTVFACDWDKYARQTFVHNYGEPDYYPEDVYDREIPTDPLDIYMTSPPCQAFSLAGKRKGEDDKRGILFYNSHEFIKNNKPRYFIFENVKGLLSDSGGLTFRRWCEYLGGKSINGNPIIFHHPESVPYHIYFRVLNAKNYGIPQNRERVFIVGIRDDHDNKFNWPKEVFLEKRLRDVLEAEVDEKYYLSDKIIDSLTNKKGDFNGRFNPHTGDDISNCLTARYHKMGATDPYVYDRIAGWHENENVVAAHRGDEKRSTVSEHVYHKLDGVCTTIQTAHIPKLWGHRIRRLTPRECFRLMDFPDSFTWPVSDTQAYKQAGNSICVGVLAGIISKLKL